MINGRLLLLAAIFSATGSVWADESVVHSKHNLSARGPGTVRALDEQQVCIFCHTPHNAQPQTALWNREFSRIHYRIYDSSTTDARIGQPSGPSKMCLSCHDGSIALGNLFSLPDEAPVPMTTPTIPTGDTDLGNDLSDDHPIGFRYDRALAGVDPQIRNPDVVSRELPMGSHGEVHCTTCHDPHDNELGDFLNITDRRGAICTTCHDMNGWELASHAVSPAPVPQRIVDPSDPLKYHTVADNACLNCHKIHSANTRERLLRHTGEEGEGCLNCHNGSVATTNILSQIGKRYGHRGTDHRGIHDPKESPLTMRQHVECVDCHNPHAARAELTFNPAALATAPVVSARNRHVSGLTALGMPVADSQFTYQICFKCHADNFNKPRPNRIQRQVTEHNVRLEFQPNNPSYHPILRPGTNRDVPSLKAPLTSNTMISCIDCHNSDQSRAAGGPGPDGPHGSIYEPLLIANYDTGETVTESERSFALCYRCHDRSSILANESFPLHNVHLVEAQASCSACHDPHGVRSGGGAGDHTHLINFDLNVVQPITLPISPKLAFQDNGRFSGSCTLVCHGVTHVNFPYGTGP